LTTFGLNALLVTCLLFDADGGECSTEATAKTILVDAANDFVKITITHFDAIYPRRLAKVEAALKTILVAGG